MRTVALKRLCRGGPQYGLNVPASEYRPTGCRLVRTSDVLPSGQLTSDDDGIFVDRSLVGDQHRLIAGDVLFSRSGTLGRCLLVSAEMEGMTFAGFLVRFRPSKATDPRFLSYYAQSSRFLGSIESDAVSSTISNFNADRYASIAVPLFSFETQRAIADFLDAETARIDALVSRRRVLAELASERLGALVEHRVREAAATFGEVPLRHAADIVVGIVITPAAWYSDSGILALRGLNVKPGRIDLSQTVRLTPEGHLLNQKSELRANDVVVVRTGQAGAAAVIPSELDGSNCIDLLRIRPSTSLDSRYLETVLNSDWTQKQISEHSVGSIQAHFNVGSLKELPIPLPPLEAQSSIVSALGQAKSKHELLRHKCEAQLVALQERKQALITAAVTGQLDLARDITDEAS